MGSTKSLQESTTVLGAKYRDKITGYEGTAVARCEYLSKCVHVELERGSTKEGDIGKPEAVWFDEERLVIIEEAPVYKDKGKKRSPGRTPPSSH